MPYTWPPLGAACEMALAPPRPGNPGLSPEAKLISYVEAAGPDSPQRASTHQHPPQSSRWLIGSGELPYALDQERKLWGHSLMDRCGSPSQNQSDTAHPWSSRYQAAQGGSARQTQRGHPGGSCRSCSVDQGEWGRSRKFCPPACIPGRPVHSILCPVVLRSRRPTVGSLPQ